MFPKAPTQVESTMVPKKGRKNKEATALVHFQNSVTNLENSLNLLSAILKQSSEPEVRTRIRSVVKEVRDAKKLLEKYKNIQYKPKRARESHNTGLEKLRPISKSMAVFAGWEYGVDLKSRYDVTNELCRYIKENSLQDPTNGTIIIPDAKLRELLQVEDDINLKYPTMQKYLKNCFDVVEEEEVKKPKEPKAKKEPKEVSNEEEEVKKPKAKKEPKVKK